MSVQAGIMRDAVIYRAPSLLQAAALVTPQPPTSLQRALRGIEDCQLCIEVCDGSLQPTAAAHGNAAVWGAGEGTHRDLGDACVGICCQ